jgi:hypothetical protein
LSFRPYFCDSVNSLVAIISAQTSQMPMNNRWNTPYKSSFPTTFAIKNHDRNPPRTAKRKILE